MRESLPSSSAPGAYLQKSLTARNRAVSSCDRSESPTNAQQHHLSLCCHSVSA